MKIDESIIGKRYGKLKVVSFEKFVISNAGIKTSLWKCKCDCGNEIYVKRNYLTNGDVKSCGCLKTELLIKRSSKHGKCRTKLYYVFCAMKQRCYNPKSKSYSSYGGRGITICDEWLSDFNTFYAWAVESGYKNTLTIERLNVNGNYEPNNCTWIPMSDQSKNRRVNRVYSYNGKEKNISEWAKELGINRYTLSGRIDKLGYSFEEAIRKDKNSNKRYKKIYYNGNIYNQKEFSEIIGYSTKTIQTLHKSGMSYEDIAIKKVEEN